MSTDGPEHEDVQPRPEPAPLPWSAADQASELTLSVEQKAAAERAFKLVERLASAQGPGPALWAEHMAMLYRTRKNHVILLDGGRGSGKTTLLVSLLYAWACARAREAGQAVDHEPGFDELVDKAGEQHIVPLRILDLQPFPDSRELILSIAGRLERVIRTLEKVSAPAHADQMPAHHSPLVHGHAELSSRRAWREFAQAVGMGWAHGRMRDGDMDLDSWALQLEDAEMRGMDVERSFGRLMDALIEDYERTFRRNGHLRAQHRPLFVIPIDDADMNPSRSMEALNLVRTLWHPRLVYLMTGHTDLFESVLRQRMFADIVGHGRQGVGGRPEKLSENADEHAARLARDVFRKVVPPAHRCQLSGLPPAERLAWLRACEVQMLGWNELLTALESSAQLPECLPRYFRHLHDLVQSLAIQVAKVKRQAGDAHTALTRMVEHIWAETMQRENYTLHSSLAQIAQQHELFALETKPEHHEALSSEYGHLVLVVPSEQLYAKDKSVPTSVIAAYLLAVHLVTEYRDVDLYITMPPLVYGVAQSLLIRDQTIKLPSFGWLIPQSRYHEANSIRTVWKSVVNELGDRQKDVHLNDAGLADLFWRFVGVVLDAHRGQYNSPHSNYVVRERLIGLLLEENLPWGHLAHESLASNPREQSFKQWLIHILPLLAAPEYGLPDSVANSLFDVYRKHVPEETLAEQRMVWRRIRKAVLRRALQDTWHDEDDVEAALAKQFPQYVFAQQWEKPADESADGMREELAQRFVTNLGHVKLHRPEHMRWPGAAGRTLDDFLRTDARQASLLHVTAEAWEPLMQHFKHARGVPGAALPLFKRLWNQAVVQASVNEQTEYSHDTVALENDVFKVATLRWLAPSPEPLSIQLDNGMTAQLYEFPEHNGFDDGSGDFMEPLLELLYRMAWDLACIYSGASTPWGAASMPELAIKHKEGELTWPCPLQLPLFTQERVTEAWTKQVVEQDYLPDSSPRIRLRVISRWWLENMARAFVNPFQFGGVGIDLAATPGNLVTMRQAIKECHKYLAEWAPAISDPREDWRLTWPMLAAPEFGLDDDSARDILESFPDEPDREAIEARRREYVTSALEHGQALLARMDAATKHPWYRWLRGEKLT